MDVLFNEMDSKKLKDSYMREDCLSWFCTVFYMTGGMSQTVFDLIVFLYFGVELR